MATNAPAALNPDEFDPELYSLKRKRAGIGPVLAATVALLCAYMLWTLRADFGYALADKQARDFGDAAAAYRTGGSVADNAYVSLSGRADLQGPGWLRGKQAIGYRVMPLLGSSGRLWIHVSDDSRAGPPVYDLGYSGRTRRIDDLAFRDELDAYVQTLPAQPHWISAEALAGGAGKAQLRDVHGDLLTLAPDTPVELDERVAGVALVTAYPNDTIKDEAGARAALVAAGLTPAANLARKTDRSWTFEVAAPDGLPGVRATISKASLYAAMASDSVSEQIVRHAGSWKDVSYDPAGQQIKLSDGRSVPLSSVASLIARVKPSLPADAAILLTDEKPDDFWYVLPLYGLLVLVLGLMVWATVRALRSDGPMALPLSIKPPELPSEPDPS